MSKTGIVLSFEEADVFMAEQLKDLRLDYIGIHPWGGKKSVEGIDRTIEHMQTPEYKKFADIVRQSGKKIEFEAHVQSWLYPKNLFQEHPDWFREDDSGKRIADFNMCVSNDKALSCLADRAAGLAALLKPDTDNYCWWTDDTDADCFCHCPGCRNLTPSDQYMIWCNTVLKGIRRINPRACLSYIAYFATMPVPKKIMPEEGIFLEYAPYKRDSFIPIANTDCEKNKMETGGLPELLEFFGSRNSRVLEYWIDNSRFSLHKKPFRKLQFDPEIMKRDVAYYRSSGFEVITSFACWTGREYQAEYGSPDFNTYVNLLRREGDSNPRNP